MGGLLKEIGFSLFEVLIWLDNAKYLILLVILLAAGLGGAINKVAGRLGKKQGASMITVKISNIDEVVRQKKSWFTAKVLGMFVALPTQVLVTVTVAGITAKGLGRFVDLGSRVEAGVIKKLRALCAEHGIEAEFARQDDDDDGGGE